MDCFQCLCQDKDQEQVMQGDQARALFLEAQQHNNRSRISQSGVVRGRDQRKSLKRPLNLSFLNGPNQPNCGPLYEPHEQFVGPSGPSQRHMSTPMTVNKNDNQFQRKRFSEPFAFNGLNRPQNESHMPQFQPQPQPKSNQQSTTVTITTTTRPKQQKLPASNPVVVTPNTIVPIQQTTQTMPVRMEQARQAIAPAIKFNVNVIPSRTNNHNKQVYTCPQQIAEQEFRKDLNIVIKQQASKSSPKTQEITGSTAHQQQNNFLHLPINLNDNEGDVASSRISRSISGVRNLDDIACTKTESIGSSSDSSSELSEIIYTLDPLNLNRRKMTNSSINFVAKTEQFLPQLLSQNITQKKKSSRQSCINK